MLKVKLHSMFVSIDGEVCSSGQGGKTLFVRFSGCPFKCSYCDSQFAEEGLYYNVTDVTTLILETLEKYKLPKVTITGGEPLYQGAAFKEIMGTLVQEGIHVSVETALLTETSKSIFSCLLTLNEGGSICVVWDYKLPSSDVINTDMPFADIDFVNNFGNSYVKMVIGSEEDYIEAKRLMKRTSYTKMPKFYLSPVHGKYEAKTLVENIIKDNVECGMNLQIHKYIWSNNEEGENLLKGLANYGR